MATQRRTQTRAAASRKADMRTMPKPHYQSRLHVPQHAVPTGMTYAWVRVATRNEPDPTNWQNKSIGGWKPVPRERHIELFPYVPVAGLEQNAEIINVGDLILCEKPTAEVQNDRKQQERETRETLESIEWTLDGPAAAPTFNESSRVQVERVVAEFQDD